MNSQQIVDQSEFTDFKAMFYPELAAAEQTDLNITKILRDLR